MYIGNQIDILYLLLYEQSIDMATSIHLISGLCPRPQ